MAQEEKVFADGFVFKRNENAPEFVIGRLSIKVDDAVAFMKDNAKNGWVNLNVKQARSGNYYMDLDTYEPKADGKPTAVATKVKAQPQAQRPAEDEDLPF